MADRRPLRWKVARIVGSLALTGQLVALLVISTRQYHHFELSLDFAMFHQAWHGVAHGNLNPQVTFLGYSFWRNQAAFVIWLLAPVYYLYPHAIDLLWIQDLAAVGAELVAFFWIVEALERRRSPHTMQAWIVTTVALVVMVANPWIYLTIVQDFHVETLTALFFVLAGRELWRQRPARAWIWAGLTLSTGTVGGFSVIALGIAAILVGSPAVRRHGLALFVAGSAWLAVITSAPADFGGGTNDYAYLAGPGPHPSGVRGVLGVIAGVITHPERAFNMIGDRASSLYENFASFGYAGVLWPWAGVVILLTMTADILNSFPGLIVPSFQNVVVYVLGAAGTALVLGRIVDWQKGRLVALLLAGAVIANAIVFSANRMPQVFKSYPIRGDTAHELGTALDRTPADAEVITSFGVAGRFAGRRSVYLLTFAGSNMVGAPPHPTFPVAARTVVFVFVPDQGNEPVNVAPAIPYVRNQLHSQILTERAGAYAYLWHPPAGTRSVTLPLP